MNTRGPGYTVNYLPEARVSSLSFCVRARASSLRRVRDSRTRESATVISNFPNRGKFKNSREKLVVTYIRVAVV